MPPLTGQEKTQLAQLSSVTAQLAIVEAAGLAAGPATLVALPFLPVILGLTAAFSRIRFPRISTGDIGRTARAAATGSVITTDPFFGDVVISQPDQADFLTELVRNSAIRRIRAEQDTARLFLDRRAVIEGLAETGADRGFATTIDPNLRGGVFRPSADAPLEFRQGAFLE